MIEYLGHSLHDIGEAYYCSTCEIRVHLDGKQTTYARTTPWKREGQLLSETCPDVWRIQGLAKCVCAFCGMGARVSSGITGTRICKSCVVKCLATYLEQVP